jgi:hypothetical protein
MSVNTGRTVHIALSQYLGIEVEDFAIGRVIAT